MHLSQIRRLVLSVVSVSDGIITSTLHCLYHIEWSCLKRATRVGKNQKSLQCVSIKECLNLSFDLECGFCHSHRFQPTSEATNATIKPGIRFYLSPNVRFIVSFGDLQMPDPFFRL